MLVLGALEAALTAADARSAIKRHASVSGNALKINHEHVQLSNIDSIYVIGAGKASGHMAEALSEILGDRISGGLVIVPDYLRTRLRTGRIQLLKGAHPIPDHRSVRSTIAMLDLVRGADRKDLVVCLISGGGSALMAMPYGGLTIEDKQSITSDLLRSGATIQELNRVRKHLSAVKGGRLAELLQRPRIISLIISDVVGDRLDTVASGPTVPDSTTFRDALYVLKKYGLWRSVDRKVRHIITMGESGKIPETPKPGSRVFRNVKNFLIGNNRTACEAAVNYLENKGIKASILMTSLQGEARNVGVAVSSLANMIVRDQNARPVAVVMGGETTVRVRRKGIGGRNQELVLSACRGIGDLGNTVVASMGTDGIDGNSDAAGAIADSLTLQRAVRLKLDPHRFLRNNDSNTFFTKLGDTILTGSTGTNVNDIVILLCL